MLSVSCYPRQSLLRSLLCYVTVVVSLLLVACGANDTGIPPIAPYYPLLPEYSVKDEYFIGVNMERKSPSDPDPVDTVYDYIGLLHTLPIPEKTLTDIDKRVLGCGGSIDKDSFIHRSIGVICVRLPRPDAMIDSLRQHPLVRYVESHGYVKLTGVQVCPPSWGLDQINQNLNSPTDGVYSYEYSGRGAHIYVVDTGIGRRLEVKNDKTKTNKVTQDEFSYDYDNVKQSRLVNNGIYFVRGKDLDDPLKLRHTDRIQIGLADDCIGHGTRIAGIAAGKKHGVAKSAIVHSVRIAIGEVLDYNTTAPPTFEEKECPATPATSCQSNQNVLAEEFSAEVNAIIGALQKLQKDLQEDDEQLLLKDVDDTNCKSTDCQPIAGHPVFSARKPTNASGCKTNNPLCGLARLPSIVLLPFTTQIAPSSSLEAQIKDLINTNRALVVVSAGNHVKLTMAIPAPSKRAQDYSPSNVPDAITVAAFNEARQFANSSNEGSSVDIIAPGENIRSIVPESLQGNCPQLLSGTSAAAAFVAGVLAQIVEAQTNNLLVDPTNAVKSITKILTDNAISGIASPADTTHLALQSPYIEGKTGNPEKSNSDGCNDAVSFLACEPGTSCEISGFCGNVISNRCCKGIESSIDATTQCGRGVVCGLSKNRCASCGLKDEHCCGGNTCGSNLTCTDTFCKCGFENQSCCNGSSCNDSKLGCIDNKCVKCGDNKEVCCPGSSCNDSKLGCIGNKCVECGQANQVCCAGSFCSSSDLGCIGNKCVPCGQDGDVCCAGSSCSSSDLGCIGNKCVQCGDDTEVCCPGALCNDPKQVCAPDAVVGKNTCQNCGQRGQPCCTKGDCNDGISVCGISGTCEHCGFSGEPCCKTGPVCLGGGDSCKFGKCGEWAECRLRCKNGEDIGLGALVNQDECKRQGTGSEGAAKCASCGASNPVFRVRYSGRLVSEDPGCGKKGVACCARKMAPNDESLNQCDADDPMKLGEHCNLRGYNPCSSKPVHTCDP